MGINLIYGSEATVGDLIKYHEKFGMEFVVEDGIITQIVTN